MTNLQTIHNHFANNFMDVRTDGQKAQLETFINQGLNLALQETENPQLVGAFAQNVLAFDPTYASKIVAHLSGVIANTGDQHLIALQQKIIKNYELPARPIFVVSASVH